MFKVARLSERNKYFIQAWMLGVPCLFKASGETWNFTRMNDSKKSGCESCMTTTSNPSTSTRF